MVGLVRNENVKPPALTMHKSPARARTPTEISYRDGRWGRSTRAAANAEVVDHPRRPADPAGEALGLSLRVGRLGHPAQGNRSCAGSDDDPPRAYFLVGFESRSRGRGDGQVAPSHTRIDLYASRSLGPGIRNAPLVPAGAPDAAEGDVLSDYRLRNLECDGQNDRRASYPLAAHRPPRSLSPATRVCREVGVHRARRDVNPLFRGMGKEHDARRWTVGASARGIYSHRR